MFWIQYDFGIRKPMAKLDDQTQDYSITIVSYTGPLITRPQLDMCIHDKNQLLKACI